MGSKGKEGNDIAATSAATGTMDQQQARKMLDTINNPTKTVKPIAKRSDLFGESSSDPTIKFDEVKVLEAMNLLKKKNNELDESMQDNITGKKRGGYNSMKGVDVSIEDMEAYRMSKTRRDDPMANFQNDDD